MSHIEGKMKKMIFDAQTTYKTDFPGIEIVPPTFTLFKEKSTCLRTLPLPLKDLHTLTNWREKAVPFSLMHRPKPVVRQDPTKVQQEYVKPTDEKREETIKTRPRLVITPACGLDDIEDSRVRDTLINDIYTSSMAKATREGAMYYVVVKAPLPGLPAPANPITLPKLQFPYVAPEWRMETISWDNKQLRTYCDATKEFWLREKVPPCRPCRDTEVRTANKKRYCQMKTEKQG